MRKITYPILSIALASLLVTGCRSGRSTEDLIAAGNPEEMSTRKKELLDKQKALGREIALLDKAMGASGKSESPALVTTFRVSRSVFSHYVELQGDVTTKQNVLIYPEMAGTLLNVYVKEGQNVKKGQLLATIDDGGTRSGLLQMETELALLKTTYERQAKLWEQKIGSEIQYLQAKANYEANENAVKQLVKKLDKFSIEAPFSGIIDDVIKDRGTVVSPGPGSEVFRIVNLSNMYVEVDVPESHLSNVTKGKKVTVFFPMLNETIESNVRQTGNFINPDNRSFTIEIPVPNSGGMIKPNLTAVVKINDYKNEQAIVIPQRVVSENAVGARYVFVASNMTGEHLATAKKRLIETGKTQGDDVEVLSGISAGDHIIEEGARSVKDGQQIKRLKR